MNKKVPETKNVLRSHCWTSSWRRKVVVVEVRGRSCAIPGFQRPPQAVGGRAVVQARWRGSSPARPVVGPCVGVTQWSARAAGARAAVRHHVLADRRGSVEVLRLVAVDNHAGVVGPRPASGVPYGCALCKTEKMCGKPQRSMVDLLKPARQN